MKLSTKFAAAIGNRALWQAIASGFAIPILAALIIGVHGLAYGAGASQAPLRIQNVYVDFTAKKIMILGQSFNLGPGPMTVSLANVGDLASDCTPNFSATPQTITCDLSAGNPPFPPAGDYLLTLSNGNGASQSDEWDLTIGAVGPPGPQGPAGIVGLEGQACPTNQFVTGFDTAGKIICSGESDAPPPPQPCTSHVYTFTLDSSHATPLTAASWPGGRSTEVDPNNSSCSVTVQAPGGDVATTMPIGAPQAWVLASQTGYSACSGTGGPNNDGVAVPDCSQLDQPSTANVVSIPPSSRPVCSTHFCVPGSCGGSGIAVDTFTVSCE